MGSWPPDNIRPSGNADEDGRYETEFMNAEPWEEME
jgi:hypothetical protein